MIPYFQFISFHIGPVTIYVWGTMVALGILAGTWVSARLAKERGLDPSIIWDAAAIAALAGIIGARVAYVFFYNPSFFIAHPAQIIALWNGGMSISGSIVCAAVALLWFLRSRKVDMVAYLDAIAYGTPLAYGIGRIGCFLIHDHPGTLTHFILGVKYPGGTRHDLGLYESFNGFGLFIIFLILRHKKAKPPTYAVAFLLWYGVVRFFLDFLRINDARYFGLTAAQYLAALMFCGGVAWLIHLLRQKPKPNHPTPNA